MHTPQTESEPNYSKYYYRVLLGGKNKYAELCREKGFIGVDFSINQDLSPFLHDDYRDFNKEYIPLYQAKYPQKSKAVAGLSGGFTHSVCKVLENDDCVLSPDGKGNYMIGVVTGPYYYEEGGILPHRRPVRWLEKLIERSTMSITLQRSAGSSGTVCNLTNYTKEIEALLIGDSHGILESIENVVEDKVEFEMEKQLESFLIANWKQTELGKNYDILEENGEIIGQQYRTDTGPIDILAISKDKKELLVVELKKGRPSDSVVGQIQRYMGFVLEEVVEKSQTVRGVIIGLGADKRIKRALSVTNNIQFYRYEISFKLIQD